MASNLFVDTNILVFLLEGNLRIKKLLENKQINISFVTEMELLSKKFITKNEISIIESLLNCCVIYEMNQRIKTASILIMRNKRLKLPDAIIAATSAYYKMDFITADHIFDSIENAKVISIR